MVEIKVDRALKRSWDALSATMRAAKREESSGFDDYWEAVGAIIDHEPPVYLAGGCATVREFLERHVGESERTARRMVRVARHASPDDEVRFGVSRLDAALTLLEAQGIDLVHGRVPVDFNRLRVAVKRDGKAARVALIDASVDEVRAAARALQRKGRKTPAAASPTTRAVTDVFGKVAALREVTVHHAHDALTLGRIPTASWGAFAKAAAKVKLPAG
ncbi:MAG: hypothetical protein JWM10_5418 [Myxococcaceae bacterium]|nr:hypothetical protein [Myxococcaceae bacterium]